MLITIHSDRIQLQCRCHESRSHDSHFVLVGGRQMTLLINLIYVKRIWLTTEVPITEQSKVKLQITFRYSGINIKFLILHNNLS
jgi:hypothetical protein